GAVEERRLESFGNDRPLGLEAPSGRSLRGRTAQSRIELASERRPMELASLTTQFMSGISVVAILIISAVGLAVIFGVAGVIIMVGAYTAAVVGKLGGNTFVAIPVAFVVVGLLGLIVERGVIQWIYNRPLETLLATWGVGIALQVIIKLIFGSELYYVGAPKIL